MNWFPFLLLFSLLGGVSVSVVGGGGGSGATGCGWLV
jgi:hypothetical protein